MAKTPIYNEGKTCYFDIGSFPISHPLGPHAISRAAPFYFLKNQNENRLEKGGFHSVSFLFSSFSTALAVHAAVQVCHLPF